MNNDEYLKKVLESQKLEEDGEEIESLRKHREEVEDLLRESFPSPGLTLRYAGSKAKGTMIKESYDLDLASFFKHDDDSAGDTLEKTYQNIRTALGKNYLVENKTSSLRIRGKANENYGTDFHIDVVPGRFTDDTKTDCYIFQNGATKKRLKTNLQKHVEHIKTSGVTDAIKLLKLWKVQTNLQIRQFVFELMVVKLLKDENDSLSSQLEHFWQSIVDAKEPIMVEDPANPNGNDLTDLVKSAWSSLQSEAARALSTIGRGDWESIYGTMEDKASEQNELHRLQAAASLVTSPSKPWFPGKK